MKIVILSVLQDRKRRRDINNNYSIGLPYFSNNTIYNNLFKNRENSPSPVLHNTWNTTKQPEVNIIGGQYLGGNFWANTGRIDISITCSDNDHDGICDSPYKLDDNNSDYLPLHTSRVPLPLESGLWIIQRITSNLQNTGHILAFEIANKSTIPGKRNEAIHRCN